MSDASPRSRATIDDVARQAGVSTATVSRALRAHPYVAESTRQRVLDAVEELHYVANASAARLASGQSRTVGLITPMLTTWYTSELMVGVEEVLTQARFDLLIGTANPAARERIFLGDARFEQRVEMADGHGAAVCPDPAQSPRSAGGVGCTQAPVRRRRWR